MTRADQRASRILKTLRACGYDDFKILTCAVVLEFPELRKLLPGAEGPPIARINENGQIERIE